MRCNVCLRSRSRGEVTTVPDDHSQQADDERPYGRRAFLLLLAGGVSSLAWATKSTGIFSPVTSAVSQLVGNIVPVGGWLI